MALICIRFKWWHDPECAGLPKVSCVKFTAEAVPIFPTSVTHGATQPHKVGYRIIFRIVWGKARLIPWYPLRLGQYGAQENFHFFFSSSLLQSWTHDQFTWHKSIPETVYLPGWFCSSHAGDWTTHCPQHWVHVWTSIITISSLIVWSSEQWLQCPCLQHVTHDGCITLTERRKWLPFDLWLSSHHFFKIL